MIKMKKMMKRCLAAGLAAVCLISALPAGNMTVRAEEADSDTINLRFIVTSDIHGQMMSTDYESGRKNVHAGLEKLLTGIEEARVEVQEDNSFTFDLGDILFDYTTENIFTADSTAKQPIWDAYKQMGYDAFTLGNHDFDYGFSYIADQLFQAGLTSKCVVSNLWKTSSGEYPFRDSMMIQKLVTAEDGTEVLIKVGIVGETIPVLSQKTEVMTGQLTTEDIVKNASRKAKELKEDGADLVIVLAHSGFGTEEPEEMDGNVAYALTKIPEVDVVFAGHEHKTFPNGDGDAIVYSLPETDPQTALVNGKNLVMPGSRADQFGVVDLKCVLQDEELVIRDRSSEVRTVDALTTVSAYGITEELYGGFLDMFQEHNTKTIATIADGMTYHNYFGMIQDNAALQLVNDAKLAYAMKYQNSLKGSKYAGLPVVAASGYSYYGQNQDSDYVSVHTGADSSNYINLSGKLTGADITSLQIYHAYIVLYQVTGKQLREYMEWPASAYATIGEEEEGWNYLLPALIAPEWRDDWSNFRIFDGVEYTIDPSVAPRYSFDGTKINNTRRISSLTINGKPVKDDDVLILACDRIIKPTEANESILKTQLLGGYVSSQNYFASWLEEQAKAGEIAIQADHNWKLDVPESYVFLADSGEEGDRFASQESWYVSTMFSQDGKQYYCGAFQEETDTTGPNLVVTPDVTVPTNRNVILAVTAHDASDIKKLQFYRGDTEADSSIWSAAPEVKDGKLSVTQNGTYTFRAEDKAGNVSLVKAVVDNIDREILQVPSLNTYSNRMASISGMAEPGATVFMKASGKSYTTRVEQDGSFSYALPNQPSGTKVEVYVKDGAGRISDTVVIQVKRTGPNRPTVSPTVKNKDTKVTGTTNDADALPIVIIGSYVYGSKDALNRYRYSEIFDEKLKMTEREATLDKKGAYMISIPVQNVETVVTVYNLDSLGRASRKRGTYVREKAPNKPVVYTVTDAERQIKGKVEQLNKNERYEIQVTLNGKTYSGETDRDGYYCIELGKLSAGDSVKVVARDLDLEKPRTSASRTVTVQDYGKYNKPLVRFDPVHTGDKVISGICLAGGEEKGRTVTLLLDVYRYEVECDENGRFELPIKNRIFGSSLLYAVVRENGNLEAVVKAEILPEKTTESVDE